jgi:homoserine/homoserine lactone efflux protein
MTNQLFLGYLLATTILVFIPGPTVLLVVSYALSHGRRSAFATIAGVLLGDVVAMALALAGVGALLRASAEAFVVMKTVGGLYLLYLGIRMWRLPPRLELPEGEEASERRMAADAFTVTVLNPKSGIFFVAFLPQFFDATRPLLPQTLLLGGTFLALAFASVLTWALLASAARDAVKSNRVAKAVNRLGGSALVAAGVLTAALKRA